MAKGRRYDFRFKTKVSRWCTTSRQKAKRRGPQITVRRKRPAHYLVVIIDGTHKRRGISGKPFSVRCAAMRESMPPGVSAAVYGGSGGGVNVPLLPQRKAYPKAREERQAAWT